MTIFKWIVIALIVLGIVWIGLTYQVASVSNIKNMLSGIFFIDSSTEELLRDNYATAQKTDEKVKILIVPGHDKNTAGAVFQNIKEVDLNIKIAEELYNLLSQEKSFQVFLSQNKNGYNSDLLSYFEKEKTDIEKFREKHKTVMNSLIKNGLVETKSIVEHNYASSEASIKLYGINKWANENNMDIVIHIHINDYPGRKYNRPGEYSGFSIYVPEKQYSNAKGSRALAEAIFQQMKKYFPISDLPQEKQEGGIIEDQDLIAIGSYNSLNAAVLLIEYGYIYESRFTNPNILPLTVKETAMQTYLGIKDFFKKINKNESITKDTSILPYQWKKDLVNGIKHNQDVFALQTALLVENLYPPMGYIKNDCPINGNFGPCTKTSVSKFQNKYEIEPPIGIVGPKTRKKLNELYGK